MRAAVLGCGPAGLMAAWALKREGFTISIFSRPIKSQFAGAQYLHNRIPGITPDHPDTEIDFIKIGTAEGYQEKAHGKGSSVQSSWETMPTGLVEGWSLKAAYDRLWQELHEYIWDMNITSEAVMQMTFDYDLVVSSIPLRTICYQHHLFVSGQHKIVPCHELIIPEDTIIYNGYPVEDGPDGTPVNWWHRGSNIDGHAFLETALDHPGQRAIAVTKPIETNCTCFNEKFVKVGRFGCWDKTVLADQAFWDIYNKMAGV